MKIEGTVKNANTDEVISGAKVVLSVAETELAVLYTNEKGKFETSQSGDYIGRTLVCNVGKAEFEDTEVKQSIEEEEIKFKIELIPVYVPPKMISINGSVVDANSKSPIDGADLTFKVGKEKIDQLKTGTDGSFSFEIKESNIGKKLKYEIKKEGYQPLKGKIEVSDDMGALELRLTTGINIPVWMGLESKRKFFLYGSMSYIIVILLLIISVGGTDSAAWFVLIAGSVYILATSAIIKGYLVPVLSSLPGMFWSAYVLADEGAILLIFCIHLVVGLISTFFARRRALKSGYINDEVFSKEWLDKIFKLLTKSRKRLLLIFGAGILLILILLIIIIFG